jgi:hypothetical protein
MVDESVIVWLDPAGVALARSFRPENWREDAAGRLDFRLLVDESAVEARQYV